MLPPADRAPIFVTIPGSSPVARLVNLDALPSPARVSAAAAAKLSRVLLALLLLIYILTGTFTRAPWQERDAAGFGVMQQMATGSAADWWLPNVAGEFVADDGPLAYWVGAVSIRLLGPAIGEVAAARIPTVLWFFIGTAALWYGVLRLARRADAQPVAFAFGGEASNRDYGRMVADIALLLLLGTLGLLVVLRETSAEPAAFAMTTLVLFGIIVSLERAIYGAVLAGVALGGLFLAHGVQPGVWMAVGAAAAIAYGADRAQRLQCVAVVLAAAVSIASLWWFGASSGEPAVRDAFFAAWRARADDVLSLPSIQSVLRILRNAPWYTWPLWPLALWALFAWRQSLGRAHIAVPGIVSAALGAALLTGGEIDSEDLLFIIVPLVPLAAFGTVALRRAAENAMDFFAIATFTVFAVGLWAYFIALQTGTPPKMAASVVRLIPDYVARFDLAAVVVAIVATLLWLALVRWRVRAHSGPMWRGPMMAAGGLIALWVVFANLYLPLVDYRRSFARPATEVAAQLVALDAADACVIPYRLRPSHLAVFVFHGKLRFAQAQTADCRFLLQRDLTDSLLDDNLPAGRWNLVWQGSRPGRSDELIRLYRRLGG